MDKLRIRVVEWQTAEGAVRDWSTISGDYIVGPSGSISLPFIGEMPAAGKTTAEIAAAIGEELQQKLGLPDRPDASVELAEFRPVFVSGDVETPGKYPYDPQLTVLKAVSLAGGLRRSADSGERSSAISSRAQGNYACPGGAAQRPCRQARQADRGSRRTSRRSSFPRSSGKAPDGQKLIADETAFMAAREKRLRLQLAAIDDLKQLLQSEIASLEKKIATQNRQVELSRTELKGIGNLADQGLVVNARVLSIEQTIAELEGKVLDMETASLRAKQDIAKATQDATTLQNDRDAEIAQDRQQAEADIEEVTLKMGMHTNLMAEALARDPAAAGNAAGTGAPRNQLCDRADDRRKGQPRRRPTRTRRSFPEMSSRSRSPWFPRTSDRSGSDVMKIAKARLVSPDHNFWYGLMAVAVSIFVFAYSTLFGQISVLAYYALWLPLILVDYRHTLGNYAKFYWIVAFAMFACLSVFWSAAPGVTARAGLQLLSHVACALIAARTVSIRTLTLGIADRRPLVLVLFAGLRRLSLRSARRQLQLRRRFCIEEPARAVRLARYLFRLCLHLHSARTRRCGGCSPSLAAGCPDMRWSPRSRPRRSSRRP